MRIFIIGQCSLHWGRMENGNLGNYYVLEPLIRELHQNFPYSELVTTMQLTEEFQKRENIKVLPLKLYYNWENDDIKIAEREYEIAKKYKQTGKLESHTPFIDEVLKSDLVIDFSGDMWGVNADLAGENRFYIGLLKNRVVQLLNKKNILFMVSTGPFENSTIEFAKEVYKNFDLVVLREPVSLNLLTKWGFDISKTINGACQSVLFEMAKDIEIKNLIKNTPVENKEGLKIGVTICGWNLLKGPFSRTDISDIELQIFIDAIEFCCTKLNAKVCLFSHSNGFKLSPNFELTHGRDYFLIKKLYNIIQTKNYKNNVYLFDGIYSPKEIKKIISNFDLLISGRVHCAIAGLSTTVPTVIIDYGHEPKAHKLQGFAKLYDIEDFIADPASKTDLINKISTCYLNRDLIKSKLKTQVEKVKTLYQQSTKLIKEIL